MPDGGAVTRLPFLITPKRMDHRQPGGTVKFPAASLKVATFIVTTTLLAAPLTASVIGSAIETEVISCAGWASVSSPAGSTTAVTPGRRQDPPVVRHTVSGSDTLLLNGPSPNPFTAVIL